MIGVSLVKGGKLYEFISRLISIDTLEETFQVEGKNKAFIYNYKRRERFQRVGKFGCDMLIRKRWGHFLVIDIDRDVLDTRLKQCGCSHKGTWL